MLVPEKMPYICEASRNAIKQIKFGFKGLSTSINFNKIEQLMLAERYLHRLEDNVKKYIELVGIQIYKEMRKDLGVDKKQ